MSVSPKGMTMKQYHRHRFVRLVERYGQVAKTLDTPEGRSEFICLSLHIHAAKGNVPKSWWPMVNRALRS